MVPVAVAFPMSAPEALESTSSNVSSRSSFASSSSSTRTVSERCPTVKVSLPLFAV